MSVRKSVELLEAGRINIDELRAAVIETKRQLETPIDFDRLVADGVLERNGAWWRVLDMHSLPEHAGLRINAVQVTTGTGEALVKFC